IAPPGSLGPARKTIDARGMLLLPGAVDAHTHLDGEMFDSRTADDFESGTAAAAAGGVTCVIDYAFQTPGQSLSHGIERWQEKARGRAIIDYGFHVAVWDPSNAVCEEAARVVQGGVASFKIFMMQGFEERARDYLRFFGAAAKARGLLTIHAEDQHLIGYCTERLLAAGNRSVAHFAASRPALSEAAAVARAVRMCELAGAPAYFVHLSSAAALREIRRARAAGANVIAETRPIYLHLTEERYLEPEGERYVGLPPLRRAADRDELWAALADGAIDTVATDHCCWKLHEKLGADRFTRIRPGMSNLETLVPMLHSEGVAKGRISLARMVDLVASNPAKIFGLYPRKGAIVEGADADLVVFDPKRRTVIHAPQMHSRSDYDVYEGFEVTGWPQTTISRGEVIFNDGKIEARAGRGEFVRRDPFTSDWRSV
ncbi:MAG: dihydropyrimidinase, partial [Candidatus Binataceae bacterium]